MENACAEEGRFCGRQRSTKGRQRFKPLETSQMQGDCKVRGFVTEKGRAVEKEVPAESSLGCADPCFSQQLLWWNGNSTQAGEPRRAGTRNRSGVCSTWNRATLRKRPPGTRSERAVFHVEQRERGFSRGTQKVPERPTRPDGLTARSCARMRRFGYFGHSRVDKRINSIN